MGRREGRDGGGGHDEGAVVHYVENEIESNAGEAGADDERVEEEAERRAV